MPARPTFVGSTMTVSVCRVFMIEPAITTRCQAVVTVKGKPCQCDQPGTVDRGGHAVCPKHDRAVWIEYAAIDADAVP